MNYLCTYRRKTLSDAGLPCHSWNDENICNIDDIMEPLNIKVKLCRGLLSLCGSLPLSWLYAIGGFAARVMDHVINYRKGVIYSNIARSFPDMDYDEIDRIAHQYYARIGELAAETIWFGGCRGNGDKLKEQGIYEFTNLELLLEIQEKRGVMAMKSHCGNWELFGGLYSYANVPDFGSRLPKERIFVAYKPMHNRVSDIVFYENRRAPLPDYQGLIEDSRLMRHAISNKAQRPVYVLNADQYPYQACHYVGTFLNQPTQGMLGGFSLAAKLGFAVLYMREERISRGHYRLTFEVITENARGMDPEELMRKYYSLLEEDIKKDPVNWLWSHKRWRK